MAHRRTNPQAFHRAYDLRHNETEAERKLWGILRSHQLEDIHFRRQHAIGNYIVDFCAPRQKLVIEVDGGQHIDQAEYDNERSAYLASWGYRVIRFWNHEVIQNLEGVVLAIFDALI